MAASPGKGSFEPFGTDYQAGMTGVGASENGIDLRLPGQWVDDTWADATSGAGVYYNVWRWYAPDVGRYTRPDPLGINVDDYNVYSYAVENPLLFDDPLGQLVLGPGEKCHKFNRILNRLRRLESNCKCLKFFEEKFGANLTQLIEGPLPIVRFRGGTPGGRTPCEKDPGAIWVDPKFCHLGNRHKLHRIILHELAHFADCDRQRFPPGGPIEEGAEAERACFGESLDSKVP